MTPSTTRGAAWIGVVITALGVCYTAAALTGWTPDQGYLFQAVLHLGELAVVVALAVAVDARTIGRVGLATAALGLVLLVVGELAYPAAPDLGDILFGAGPLLSGIGMVLAGIAVLRARAWRRWQLPLPLLVGVWIIVPATPIMIATGGPPSPLALTAIMVWDILWTLTGAAVLTGAVRRAPAGVS